MIAFERSARLRCRTPFRATRRWSRPRA